MSNTEAKALINDFRQKAKVNPDTIEKGVLGHGRPDAESYEMYVFGKKIKLKVNGWIYAEETL